MFFLEREIFNFYEDRFKNNFSFRDSACDILLEVLCQDYCFSIGFFYLKAQGAGLIKGKFNAIFVI